MSLRTTRTHRPDTFFPYTTLFRSRFEAGGGSGRTPPAEVRWRCDGAPPGPGVPVRVEASAHAAAAGPAASPSPGAGEGKPAIMDEVAAAGGGERDWLAGQSAGREWLFPAADYNPRSPVTRVVVKRLEGDKVALRINGVAVDGLAYEGTQTSPDRKSTRLNSSH